MPKFILIKTADFTPVRRNVRGLPARIERATAPTIPDSITEIAYAVEEDRPTFDPATERLERKETLEAYGWNVVALTAQEIADNEAAATEAAEDDAERTLLRNAYQLFKNGNASAAQIQRAIAYLIKKTA